MGYGHPTMTEGREIHNQETKNYQAPQEKKLAGRHRKSQTKTPVMSSDYDSCPPKENMSTIPG
jgi:hypothetical protein